MIDVCVPFNEERRLRVLGEYALLDTPYEEEFDRIVALTARIFAAPVATITLVDADRQFFKAAIGVTNRETPRGVAFCAYALQRDELLIVPDATLDERFEGNPLVTGEPGIRFYAGAPLASHTGDILGTLCIIDFKPRPPLSEEECETLLGLAGLVKQQMEISRLRAVDSNLKASESRFRLLVDSVTDYAIFMLDLDGNVTNWNAGAERASGYKPEEIIGRGYDCFFTAEDQANGIPQASLLTAVRDGRYEGEVWSVRKDASQFWSSVVITPMRDETDTLIGFAKICHDVTERRSNEKRLHDLAHLDALTQLPNRLALRERLETALRDELPVTLLTMDLDGFKDVNDTMGHAAGDSILKAAAQRISSKLEGRGYVGRIGGDEFAAVIPRNGDPTVAADICRELTAAFRPPFLWEQQEAYLGVSLGAALAPADGATAEALLSNADLALYGAKAEKRTGFSLFHSSMRQATTARLTCDLELRQATVRGEFELFYQPQCRLDDRSIVGAEALLRWRHPEHGLVLPGAFLSVLEVGPLASVVGDWVIDNACAQVASIRAAGKEDFRVAVNVFSAQIRKGTLVKAVTDALAKWDLPTGALELELTENIILDGDEVGISALAELRRLGVSIAFDDYGTGYASLSLLKRFPLSKLKIDQSFVRSLHVGSQDVALVRAIVDLGRSFGLEVIAEGVEQEEQAEILQKLGCRFGQGFLLGRPMAAPRLIANLFGLEASSRQHAGATK